MGLSTAFQISQSALSSVAAQSDVVSRNISGVNDPNYVRRVANLVTTNNGASVVGSVSRAADQSLYDTMLATTSASSAASAITAGLNQLEASASDPQNNQSPAALIGTLTSALQAYSAAPDNISEAQAVLTAAQNVVTSLNNASNLVQTVRSQADASMNQAVSAINQDLAKFQAANDIIVGGGTAGTSVNDALDTRDSILKDLSKYVGISTLQQPNGGMAIYTDSGVTLFETTPRSVVFTPTQPLTAGAAGNAVTIDGVPVTGPQSPMPLQSGSLAGLAQLRDTIAPTYQSQLDGIANGLISAFAESDPNATPTLPTVTGLFTTPAGPAMPGSTVGLAGAIKINSSVDPSLGGTLTLLRDGGIAGAGYIANTTGAASFGGRLTGMIAALNQTQSFNAAAGAGTSATVAGYASASIGWLEAQRQNATTKSDYQSTLQTSATQALSNTSGVNLDTEMSKMLSLENSYQASAKLLSTLNTMFGSLIGINP